MTIRSWWRTRRRRGAIRTLDNEAYWWRSAIEGWNTACIRLRSDPDNVRRQIEAIERKKTMDLCKSFGYHKAEDKLRVLLAEELAENPPCEVEE